MHCYSFISCDELSHPSLLNYCTSLRLNSNGAIVYLPSNPTQFYTLTYNGFDTCVCTKEFGSNDFVVTPFSSCEQTSQLTKYVLRNCTTQQDFVVEAGEDQITLPKIGGGLVYKLKNYPCDCFQVIEESLDESVPEFVEVEAQFLDCAECTDLIGGCNEGERTIAYALRVKLPEESIPDKGFKECCYTNLVLADPTLKDSEKNDYNSFYFKRQTPTDVCEFILHFDGSIYALNNALYGIFWDFGGFTNQDLKVYRVDWQKVLNVLGEGVFQIEKSVTIAGVTASIMSNSYTLKKYSIERANKTIRIDSLMDGKLLHYDVDFKETNFKTTLRIPGFFGKRNPKYVQDNVVKRDYTIEQISMSQENEYSLTLGKMPVCITDELYDFILFGGDLWVSDYNTHNHSYKYKVFNVEFTGNKGAKYYANNRRADGSLTFTDRLKNNKKINC